ncbi:MAG: polyamine aminopropyltransferase [Bacteroidales bacterium]|nr:polyamine aminopropyltransferase [Bacteroidales bacterium]
MRTFEIFNTYQFGKALMHDGIIMTTEKDEFIYHEAITHIPMLSHSSPKNILVIGGGDGGTIRQLLKHEIVDKITIVEIDEKVTEACKSYFSDLANSFDNPKVHLIIGDGIEYIKKSNQYFDIIIVDSTDPIGPAEGLFTKGFYKDIYEKLTENGIFVCQSESPWYNSGAFMNISDTLKKVFNKEFVFLYLATIPTYPTGLWTFSFCSKR